MGEDVGWQWWQRRLVGAMGEARPQLGDRMEEERQSGEEQEVEVELPLGKVGDGIGHGTVTKEPLDPGAVRQ